MQLEAEEPARRGLASLCHSFKDLVLTDSCIVADRHLGGVDEGDTGALPSERGKVVEEQNEDAGNVLDESLITDEARKLGFPMHLDVAGVKSLEVSKSAEMEGDEEGDDLAFTETSWSVAGGLAPADLAFSHFGEGEEAEIVDFAKESE